ncbi:MAG: PKD domain-containing protein, partial [Thaumarchaeota archaeon]|nr:PKD domain-containing protein [Nitrososphaerota archaeon]
MWVGVFAVSLSLFGIMFEDVIAQTPNANAGPDQIVGFGEMVTLDGSGSTPPPGGTITYSWLQDSGTNVVLSSDNIQPTFTAPNSPTTLVFELELYDSSISSSSIDKVTITVLGPQPPVADAGPPQTVRYGDTVTLDGRGSTDPNGDQISYSWTHTSGLSASLTGDDTEQPTFTAPSSTGTITFTLTVTAGTDSDT